MPQLVRRAVFHTVQSPSHTPHALHLLHCTPEQLLAQGYPCVQLVRPPLIHSAHEGCETKMRVAVHQKFQGIADQAQTMARLSQVLQQHTALRCQQVADPVETTAPI